MREINAPLRFQAASGMVEHKISEIYPPGVNAVASLHRGENSGIGVRTRAWKHTCEIHTRQFKIFPVECSFSLQRADQGLAADAVSG